MLQAPSEATSAAAMIVKYFRADSLAGLNDREQRRQRAAVAGTFTSRGGLNDHEKVASAGNPRAVLAFRCPIMEMPDVLSWRCLMSAIIYLVGLVVVVMFILSLIGLR